MTGDPINPPWYRGRRADGTEIEAWDVGEAFGLNHHRSTAVEYILRAGRKDGEPAPTALLKAIRWLQRDIDVMAAEAAAEVQAEQDDARARYERLRAVYRGEVVR